MTQNPLHHLLEYNLDLGKTKPDTVHRDERYCPFCDVKNLKNVMETRGHMIWLENAFRVLKDTWQTLIIETDDCDGDFRRTRWNTQRSSFVLASKNGSKSKTWVPLNQCFSTATTAICQAARFIIRTRKSSASKTTTTMKTLRLITSSAPASMPNRALKSTLPIGPSSAFTKPISS